MLTSLEVAVRSEGGVNVTGGEEGEGEGTRSSTFPVLQNLYAELEAVGIGSVSLYTGHTSSQPTIVFGLLLIFVLAVC